MTPGMHNKKKTGRQAPPKNIAAICVATIGETT